MDATRNKCSQETGVGGDTGHDATFYAENEVPGNGANHELQRLCTKAAAAGSGGVAGAAAEVVSCWHDLPSG